MSGMVLTSGVTLVERVVEEGLTVSLVCDGSANDDTRDMMGVLKATALLQKVRLRDAAAMPTSRILRLVTLGSTKAVMRGGGSGGNRGGDKGGPDSLRPLPRSSHIGTRPG